jgi:hypothetical protein
MFNFGHERAWLYLTLGGLLVFLAAGTILPVTLFAASTGVALAVIGKELVVLVISASFFLKFGGREAHRFQPRDDTRTRMSIGSLLPSAARAGFARSFPPSADH